MVHYKMKQSLSSVELRICKLLSRIYEQSVENETKFDFC